MTKEDLLNKLRQLSDEEFAEVGPFLEADLESVGELAALRNEVAEGRKSAATEALQNAREAYDKLRKALSN